MPLVVHAVNVRPVLTGSSTMPPCPKNQGFRTSTISCPGSGPWRLQADRMNSAATIERSFIWLSAIAGITTKVSLALVFAAARTLLAEYRSGKRAHRLSFPILLSARTRGNYGDAHRLHRSRRD